MKAGTIILVGGLAVIAFAVAREAGLVSARPLGGGAAADDDSPENDGTSSSSSGGAVGRAGSFLAGWFDNVWGGRTPIEVELGCRGVECLE